MKVVSMMTPTGVPISSAQKQAVNKEQWLEKMQFSCVHCSKKFKTREDLMHHYDNSRHDKYSSFKH